MIKKLIKSKLTKENFFEHNASKFPVEQILDYMKDKELYYLNGVEGCCYKNNEDEQCESIECEFYRNEELFYDEKVGFNEKGIGEEVDFAVYLCIRCNTWVSYIE